MASDYEKFEKQVSKIREINGTYLSEFTQWLKSKGLSAKTIDNHVTNIEFYINEFLCYDDALDVTHGCRMISRFLGDWFIRKTTWASCGNIKSYAAGIKKFYEFMLEKGVIEQDDYDELRETIKDEMPDWLEAMKQDEESDFDW